VIGLLVTLCTFRFFFFFFFFFFFLNGRRGTNERARVFSFSLSPLTSEDVWIFSFFSSLSGAVIAVLRSSILAVLAFF